MEEIFKTIESHNGIYMCSNYGKVKSIERFRKGKGNSIVTVKERFLKPKIDEDGYLCYGLCTGVHQKNKYYRANIIVYKTFIGEIPNGYDVHHKDGNKHNNFVENLCLIEHKKHCDMHSKEKAKPILQYTLDGEFVAEYESAFDASRQTGICRTTINACCCGRIKSNGYQNKTAGGFVWRFKEAA